MMPTLDEMDRAIARHSLPPSTQNILLDIPGLERMNSAVASLTIHRDSVRRWAEAEAQMERTRRAQSKQKLVEERQTNISRLYEDFGYFGVEPTDASIKSLVASRDEVVDIVERQKRAEQLVKPSGNIVHGADSAVRAPAIEVVGSILKEIDAVRVLDARIGAVEVRIQEVDPNRIDRTVVGWIQEYRQKGLVGSDGSGRPMLDDAVAAELQQLGILDEGPDNASLA